METSGEASTWISSATSYDHLSNAPYSQYSLIIIAKSRLSVNWKYKKPFPLCLTGRTGCAIFISNLKYVLKGEPMAQNRQDMGSGPVKPLLLQLMIPTVVAQVVNLLYRPHFHRPHRGHRCGGADGRGPVCADPYAPERLRHAHRRGRCAPHGHRAGTGQ